MENLYNDNKQDNGQQHDQIFVAIIAVVDGDLTQAAAADDTTHGSVAQDGGNGNGGIGDERGHGFRDHDLDDGLHGGSTHAAGHFNNIGIEFPQAAFHQTCHKGERSDGQRNNRSRSTNRGSHDGAGQGEQQNHENEEGHRTQQIDDDIKRLHQPAGKGRQTAFFAHHQDNTQRQTNEHSEEHSCYGNIQRLPKGQQELPLNDGECFLQNFGRKEIIQHTESPPGR